MSAPTIDLTDAEKRDLIALIQAGKALPEKHRFMLFEGKREVELVWNRKTRHGEGDRHLWQRQDDHRAGECGLTR